jgi:hypothetical protein
MASQVNELQQLEREIKRLQRKAKNIEKQMDERLDYFQDNYRSLAIRSFLPAFLAKSGLTGTAIGLFLENKKIQDALNQIGTKLFGKISDGLEFLTKKLSKKEEDLG